MATTGQMTERVAGVGSLIIVSQLRRPTLDRHWWSHPRKIPRSWSVCSEETDMEAEQWMTITVEELVAQAIEWLHVNDRAEDAFKDLLLKLAAPSPELCCVAMVVVATRVMMLTGAGDDDIADAWDEVVKGVAMIKGPIMAERQKQAAALIEVMRKGSGN